MNFVEFTDTENGTVAINLDNVLTMTEPAPGGTTVVIFIGSTPSNPLVVTVAGGLTQVFETISNQTESVSAAPLLKAVPNGLQWKGAPGNIVARGKRDTYTIQSVSDQFVLQATTGCNPNRLGGATELGPFGKAFDTLDAAKAKAQEVDNA
jgi:hypothetical protein